LDLIVKIWDKKDVDDDSFLINGLSIQGCKWEGLNLQNTGTLTNTVETVKATWVKYDPKNKDKLKDNEIFVPVYLNQTRKNLLFSVNLGCEGIEKNYLYQRGCGIIAWTL